MFAKRYRRDRQEARIASAVYGAIVAQARSPALYAGLGVPDTVAGRFEMVVLHTVVIIERLKSGGAAERTLGQRVFDLFCTDMDRSLRELGIGDLGVPRKMKRMAEGYYGRAEAYRRGLAEGDVAGLAEAIGRNVAVTSPGAAGALAAYAAAAWDALGGLTTTAATDDPTLAFPDPAMFAATGVAP